MRFDVISERIVQVFQGNVSWTIYKDGELNSPVRSERYAVVEVMYEDGTVESFVAPLIISKDGLQTWANYFPDIFIGVLHQEEKPTPKQIIDLTKEMDLLEKEIQDMFDGALKEIDEKEESSLIKFTPKKKIKPVDPDGDK